MFTQEGSFNAVVKEAMLSNPPDWRKDAGPCDFDVCLKLARTDNEAETDWWRGEFSQNFSKQKNKEHLRQCDITMEALHNVGFEGHDLTTIAEQMVGKTIQITVKQGKPNAEGKAYMNVYLGSYGPVALDKDEAARRVAAMFGNRAEAGAAAPAAGNAQPAASTVSAPATEKPNPLVKCSVCGKYGKALKSTGKCQGC